MESAMDMTDYYMDLVLHCSDPTHHEHSSNDLSYHPHTAWLSTSTLLNDPFIANPD